MFEPLIVSDPNDPKICFMILIFFFGDADDVYAFCHDDAFYSGLFYDE